MSALDLQDGTALLGEQSNTVVLLELGHVLTQTDLQ